MNKMKTLFIALLCMGVGTLSAQTADSTQISPWTKEGFAGLKLTQVSLTNWAAGGDNSVAFDLQGTYQINYKKLPQEIILGSETASTVSSRGVYKFPVERKAMAVYDDHQSSSYDVEHCGWSNLPEDDFIQHEELP